MIPLHDDNPSPITPIVTYVIIGVCALLFFFEMSLGRQLQPFLMHYGMVPARYTDPDVARHFGPIQQAIPFITSMFLHGGWLHVIGNMWTLYIFGDNVEASMGHRRFLLFYLLCGLAAGLLHLFTNMHSTVPTIGASGAIAGVMGAYFLLYPRARVLVLLPIFFFFTIIYVPAFVFLAFWFFIQFFNGAFALAAAQRDFGGIAWWAHIGGFVVGLALIKFFAVRQHSRHGW